MLYGIRNYHPFKKMILYPSTLGENIRFTWNFAVVTWSFLLSWADELSRTSANLRTGLLLSLWKCQRASKKSKLGQFSPRMMQELSLKKKKMNWMQNHNKACKIFIYLSLFSSLELMRQSQYDFVLYGRCFKTRVWILVIHSWGWNKDRI